MLIRPHRGVRADGKFLEGGEAAEVSEKTGRFLVNIGRAVELDGPEPEPEPEPEPGLEPEDDEDIEQDPPSPKKRGRKPKTQN